MIKEFQIVFKLSQNARNGEILSCLSTLRIDVFLCIFILISVLGLSRLLEVDQNTGIR